MHKENTQVYTKNQTCTYVYCPPLFSSYTAKTLMKKFAGKQQNKGFCTEQNNCI